MSSRRVDSQSVSTMMWSTPMRSRAPSVDGSSIVQNQKLRRTASLGEISASQTPAPPDPGVRHHVIEAIEQHRDPADAAFGQRDVETRETKRDARVGAEYSVRQLTWGFVVGAGLRDDDAS
jgi:hypothetical protein